jgi:hypothetical protein
LYRWLQGPDPELQSVKDEIEDLKTREVEYLKILQAAASAPPAVPEKDWSNFLSILILSSHGITITLPTKWVSM